MNQELVFALLILFSYLCASTPFGYLIAKSKKIDILKQGSGNVGGTNILRSLGFSYFLLVVILDILKVAIPVLLAQYFLLPNWEVAIVALFAIIGNMFSFWLKFKGGKAVSAVFAVFICLVGLKNALLFLIAWVLFLFVLKIMSLTNLILVFTIPVAIWFSTGSTSFTILGILFIPIVWWAHRENIKRLIKGTEPKIIKF